MKSQREIVVVRSANETSGSRSESRLWIQTLASSTTTVLWFLALSSLSATALSADDVAVSNDPLWKSADQAYESGQYETAHIHLKALIDKNPGDVDLAVQCLELIFNKAGRRNREDHWAQYAAGRLCALQRVGVVSANSRLMQDAFEITIARSVPQGQLLESVELVDRLVEENPHDLYWRIAQATTYRAVDSRRARPLYDKLAAEMDLDHPDQATRARWTAFSAELESNREKLPQIIRPLPKGSLLPLMEPDDPDGEWAVVADRPVREIPRDVDRLAGKAMVADHVVLWRDMSGLVDPARALDLHLLSQPKADLEPLRKLQAERYAQEDQRSVSSLENALALYRRYAWALPAQRRLLARANRMLWAGRPQSALRSFRDLLDHATDAKLRDAAQVGYWTALAQTESLFAPRTKRKHFVRGAKNDQPLNELLDGVDPNRSYTWLGKPTKAGEICQQLIASWKETWPPTTTTVPTLKDLTQHVVHLPPVSPWSTDMPATVDLVVVGSNLLASGRDMLVMYHADKPTEPIWSSLQRHHAEAQRRGGYYPGYFRPLIDGRVLYTRWGFSSVPRGVAAFDLATGRPLWSNEGPWLDAQRRRKFNTPLGDPVLSDGLLYYLQWNTQDNVNQSRGRRLSIACFDPRRRETVWESTIAEAGLSTDIQAHLERAPAASAIYGNRLTVHQGAIYSNSNCGIVARSDVRDGRTDWIHYYRPNVNRPSALNLGSPPVVAGKLIILMPRDSTRGFALDQQTGRLVWENPLVLGVQIVGTHDDLLIVRGQSTIAGLDLATGEVRWFRPIDGPILGRAQLSNSSIYLARLEELLRLDAKTGNVEEVRSWELKGERPQNFTIHGRDLYVVTDKPADDLGRKIGQPLRPAVPVEAGPEPLARAWSLPRENAMVTLPPQDSPLHGMAYILSSGILECIDVSARGSIRWRRFVDARNPSVHLVGKTMLVVDHGNGRATGLVNRALAYDATDGRFLWERAIPNGLQQTVHCGSTQIFHDARSHIVAVDLADGRRIWERHLEQHLGRGQLMKFVYDAPRLHVFFATPLYDAQHLLLDAQTGQTLSSNIVEAQAGPHQTNNGKPVIGGYYEVKIKSVRGRYLRLVALSEVNGQGWTSIAELQVIGTSGKNLPRDKWKIHKVDGYESKSRTNAAPRNAIDDDPVTWWHTPWIGGIPRHPHEIQIDMREPQQIAGIRYLPAVIINNNGMIRDYELYVSDDGRDWGTPVAKGYLVNRPRVDKALLSSKAIVFESHDRTTRQNRIFRYLMDGKPARMVQQNARLVLLQGSYYVATTRKDNKDLLTVHRVDNDAYRFELGPPQHFDTAAIEIVGDRLIMGRRGVLVADLAKKRFIVAPSANNLKHNQNGMLLRCGADVLIKVVSQGNQGQAIFRFDLRTGQKSEFILADQIEPFQDRRHSSQHQSIQHFGDVVLLNDSSTVTAWIARDDSKD